MQSRPLDRRLGVVLARHLMLQRYLVLLIGKLLLLGVRLPR